MPTIIIIDIIYEKFLVYTTRSRIVIRISGIVMKTLFPYSVMPSHETCLSLNERGVISDNKTEKRFLTLRDSYRINNHKCKKYSFT